MTISQIDHIALPIQLVQEMLAFYKRIGFVIDNSMAPRLYSAQLKDQKINFHAPELWRNERFTLRGPTAQPGCGDICLVWDADVSELRDWLQVLKVSEIEGPVQRKGGRNLGREEGTSVYVRDPDQNLIEFICYRSDP